MTPLRRFKLTKEQEKTKGVSTWWITPSFFIVHNTANDASAENEARYMSRTKNLTSFHYAIDDKEVLQILEVDGYNGKKKAQGSGSTKSGYANRNGISIEICYSKSGGPRFTKAETNAIKFIAGELIRRGWGIDRVKKHQDFQKKYCPHRTLDLGWGRFLKLIESEMNRMKNEKKPIKNDKDHWAYSDYMKLKKYLEDNGKGTIHDFRADDKITRGEVFSILCRIYGL